MQSSASAVTIKRRNFGLPQLTEGFEPPLPTDEIVEQAISTLPRGHGDRAFKADFGDILDDALVSTFCCEGAD
jgi:hypothetical protein